MNDKPLISVVMPVYNNARTVCRAASSILKQTYRNLELIIVYDDSSDGTAEALQTISDPRCRIVRSPAKRGGGAARHLGISHARGEYIAEQDADDFSYPERLEVQLEYLLSNKLALCGTWITIVDADGSRHEFRQPVSPAEIRGGLVRSNLFAHTTMMFRKAVYYEAGGYDTAMLFAEDYDLWLRIVARHPAGNVPRVLAEYTAPSDTLLYIWKEQKAVALVRWRAVTRYGFPWWNIVYMVPVAAFLNRKSTIRIMDRLK